MHPAGLRGFLAGMASAMCQRTVVRRVFETMPQNGVAPSRQIGRLVLKACTESQQPELAEAFREEFQLNGVQVD